MGSATSQEALTFSRHYPGVALGVGFGVMALIGADLASAPEGPSDRPFGIVLAIVCGWLSYRGFRGVQITVDHAELRTRGWLRTRSWDLAAVQRASAVLGQVGLYTRAYVNLEVSARYPFRFVQFNTSPRHRQQLDLIAAEINAFLARAKNSTST
jgi:hypothetical protein